MCRCGLLIAAMMVCAEISGCAPVAAKTESPPPPRVTVQHPVQREIVDYKEYNGWTDASETVEIRSRVRGHIRSVNFTDGQMVEEGQLLFELDPRPFQAEVDVAEGQVDVDAAQLEYSLAEEARYLELIEKKVTTKAEYQKSVASRKSWEAKLAAAKEAVRRAALDLEYAKITSPIAGKISRAQLQAGNLVNAGGSDPLLTTVVKLDPIHVYFFVDERALLEYRQRDGERAARSHEKPLKDSQIPFDFALETDEGFPHHGILDFADNKIDPTTGTIEVRGAAANPEVQFLPGSRVRVRIPVSDPYPALLAPDVAILSDQDQRYVLSLNDENKVIRRDVTPGRLLPDGMRVILPGAKEDQQLTHNDVIIVDGLQRARLLYPVEPLDAEGKPFFEADAATASVEN
jgi:RND family efflux transporter MFP subunit